MRQVTCEQCGQATPQNSSFLVEGRTLCDPCASAVVEAQSELPEGSVTRTPDPTVCGVCEHDAGSRELEMIAGVPVCDACEAQLRNRPFPLWVKGAVAVVLVLTLFALARNYRFFGAYVAIKASERAARGGDLLAAAAQMEKTARLVPEIKEYDASAKLYRALVHMQEDRSEEALKLLDEAAVHLPASDFVQTVHLQADIGAAYDKRDFERMVEGSRRLAEMHPEERRFQLSLASAYACKFAASGNPEDQKAAREHLPPADDIGNLSDDDKAYLNRIEHRLATREIIDRHEFSRRFPSGWKREVQP